MTMYFGNEYNYEVRKEIFGHGSLNSIGETLSVETLKGKNVARCIEKSGGLNGLANFMGIDCSLVLSDATVENNTKGHAYCLIKENEKYKICDPNFFSPYGDGTRSIPFIFDLDTNINDKRITFDSGKLGAINPTVIEYDFPWSKLNIAAKSQNSKKITITSSDIATADKEKALSTSEIERKKDFFNRLLDKFRGKGEK